MTSSLLETLPLPQRLALAYAPAKARGMLLPLFAFDARLGHALRQANEPIMAQMRLAWWRDQLALEPAARERSDELVRALDPLDGARKALGALVDGWELLLSEELGTKTATAFASARAQAILASARLMGAADPAEAILIAGQRWALADLAAGLSDAEERAMIVGIAPAEGRPPLSRSLRPVAVLDGLARRSLAAGGLPLLEGPASALAAMRLGLLGR